MARWSKSAGHIKIEDGDKVKIAGPTNDVYAVVEGVIISSGGIRDPNDRFKWSVAPAILVVVRFKGNGACTIYPLAMVEAIRLNDKWMKMDNTEAVDVTIAV